MQYLASVIERPTISIYPPMNGLLDKTHIIPSINFNPIRGRAREPIPVMWSSYGHIHTCTLTQYLDTRPLCSFAPSKHWKIIGGHHKFHHRGPKSQQRVRTSSNQKSRAHTNASSLFELISLHSKEKQIQKSSP